MTNRKSTKRRLLASALTLVICIAMLVGTTFAWFTDSVTSSGNIIKSGTLDVEMYWKDATTTTGKQLTYKDASEGAIFNYDLWEPGYVEAKNIKISNVGTLALKYQLNIAANGEVSELADVIDVYFAEGEYTLENREISKLKLAGTLSDILDGMPANMSGDLEAGKDDIVTIALKMQETAGNEYQDLSIGTDFSVILMATQDTVEPDSFDNQYDKDAIALGGTGTKENPYLISNAEQLMLFSKNVMNNVAPEEGSVTYNSASYKLMSDVDLTGFEWTPIGTGANPFNGTFDGNGKTVTLNKMSGDATSLVDGSDYGYAYGFFGVIGWASEAHANEKVTIKNLNLNVSYETEDAYVMGGLVGADAAGHKGSGKNSSLACDIEITNVIVNGKVISKNERSGVTVGGIAGKLYTKGNIVIDGCTNNAEIIAETNSGKDNKVGGIVGFYSGANSVVITNNTNNGAVTSKSVNAASSKASGICITGKTTQSVNISNNTNNGDVAGTGNAVVAIAFSGNDSPICMVPEYTTKNNSNSGTLYTFDQNANKTEVLYTFLVYGGKSQTPADNTTDDSRYTGGVVVMEINETV